MNVARNMTLSVLLGSALMLASAVGCGERGAGTAGSEATAPLPRASGEQGAEAAEPELKIEETAAAPLPRGIEVAEAAPRAPTGPSLSEHGGLGLRRLVISHDVVGREPAPAPRLEAGERVYAFIEAYNGAGEERSLTVHFEGPGGRSVGHVALGIPADVGRWRTWAYSRLVDAPGEWAAVVRTTEGEEVGRASFAVE